MSGFRIIALKLALLLSICNMVSADEGGNKAPGLSHFPLNEIYSRYTADPYRTSFSAKAIFLNRTDIPDTGTRRFGLRIGGALPLMQYNWQKVQSQLVLEAGFHGHFDADHSQDNIGWDGIYSLYYAVRFNEALAVRIGRRHFSSHVGDEYIERTGRRRINYTREEWRAGLSWQVKNNMDVYFDFAYASTLRNKNKQKPWRYQIGAQFDQPGAFYETGLGWYVAADVSSYQENNYAINTTLQVGLLVPRDERQWRFFIEYYNGRMQIGEFFEHNESYFGLGLTIDI